MRSTWGLNPMSSIRSASSRTSTETPSIDSMLPIDEILQPPRGCDHDVRVMRPVRLALQRHAAVDGRHRQATSGHERLELLRHLQRELARRDEDQGRAGARSTGRCARRSADANASVLPDPVGDLASTSRPGERLGDRALLDLERVDDAARRERVDDVCAHVRAQQTLIPAYDSSTPFVMVRDRPALEPCDAESKEDASHGVTRCHPYPQGSSRSRRYAGRDGCDLVRPRSAVARVSRPRAHRPTARAPRWRATGRRSSRTARAGVTGRCASGSPSGTVSSRVGSSSPSAACRGFSYYAAAQLARRARPRARRGADLRPAAEDPRAARARRSSRCRWTAKGSTSMRSSPSSTAVATSRSSTRSRRSRTRADARSASTRRRRLAEIVARARSRRARGRPVRAGPLRRRAPAVAPRARGWRAGRVHVVVLEDRCAGAAGRLVRAARRARRRVRRSRGLDDDLAAAAAAGGRCTS